MSDPGTPTATLVSNDPVKIKITANGLSASTATQEDVAKLDFKEDKIESSQDLYVNGAKVMANSDDFKVNDNGKVEAKNLKADDLEADGLKVTNTVDAKDINVDNKIVAKDMEVKSIKVDGAKVLSENQFLTFNDSTGTLGINAVNTNDMKVKGNDVLVSSPDLSWDPVTGTLTVKNLKVVEHIEVV